MDYQNIRGCGYDAFQRHEPRRERWEENEHKRAWPYINSLIGLGDTVATLVRGASHESLPTHERDSINLYAYKGGKRDQLITENDIRQAEIETIIEEKRIETLWPEESRSNDAKEGERGIDVKLAIDFFNAVRHSMYDVAILFSMDRDVLTVLDYLETALQRGVPVIRLCTWWPSKIADDETDFGPAKMVRDVASNKKLDFIKLSNGHYRRVAS